MKITPEDVRNHDNSVHYKDLTGRDKDVRDALIIGCVAARLSEISHIGMKEE